MHNLKERKEHDSYHISWNKQELSRSSVSLTIALLIQCFKLYSSTSQYEEEQEASLWTVAQGQPESLKRRKAPATAWP